MPKSKPRNPPRPPPGAPADGPDPAKSKTAGETPDYADALRALGREGPRRARRPSGD